MRMCRLPRAPSSRTTAGTKDFSGLCPRGSGVILLQVPGTGGPASCEPPGSLCRGCASQSRPGARLGSGRLWARHVGFTTAQNTSVCGVYEREGRDREVTSESVCRALFLATSPTLFLAQLLKVPLSSLPSSFPPSHPPAFYLSPSLQFPSLLPVPLPPSLFLSLSFPRQLRSTIAPEKAGLLAFILTGGERWPGALPGGIGAAASTPVLGCGSSRPRRPKRLAPGQPPVSCALASFAFCPSEVRVDFRHLVDLSSYCLS